MDANLMNAAEGSQRKPRRHATRVAEDIAIVVAIKIVRPYRAERREKEAKWQEVARLANEALDVKDITAEMCRRRFKALIEQVARASTLPQAGSQPLDPKLFTLVMEMFVDVKNHFDEMETARVDQMQEFRRKVLLAAPPCTSSASSDSDPTRASPPPPLPPPTDPAAAITQATEEEPGSPHRSQKSTKRKTPRYATEDQVAKTRKLAALRVRPCNKRVKTLADELEALAAAFEIAKQEQREKDAAWRTQLETSQKEHDAQIHQLSRENGELRTQLVATQKKQTQQDEQIELHALESQAQQEEVAALQQALASEHEERVRLEQDVSRMKVDAAASREQTLRETYEMTMLQMNTVDEMESVLRQQRQLMREYKRLL